MRSFLTSKQGRRKFTYGGGGGGDGGGGDGGSGRWGGGF